MLTSKTPKLDLHGEIVSMVEVLVNEFIADNLKMGYSEVIIIHGKSTNILTEEVHKVLKKIKMLENTIKIIGIWGKQSLKLMSKNKGLLLIFCIIGKSSKNNSKNIKLMY